MTVKEYLKIINSVSETEELTAEKIKVYDLPGIFPDMSNCYGLISKPRATIKGDILEISKTVSNAKNKTEYVIKKETSLSDDIIYHCGRFETPQNLINYIIGAIHDRVSNREMIERLEAGLKEYESNRNR